MIKKIILRSIVGLSRPQMKIWRMSIACWVPKTTNAHSEYVKLIAFPLQQWLHEGGSILCYTFCLVESHDKLQLPSVVRYFHISYYRVKMRLK